MTMREKLLAIITYHSDDLGGEGTSGYLLSPEQIEQVMEWAADVWDEGWNTCFVNETLSTEPETNPYRKGSK